MTFQLTDDSNYQKAFLTKFLHLSEGKIVMIKNTQIIAIYNLLNVNI